MSDRDERLQRVFRQVLSLPGEADVRGLSAGEADSWDSIAHINLILAVEQEFGVGLTADEASGALSFREMLRLVESKG